MSAIVTYKGSTLTTVDNATKTLKTAGKYMEGDVIITDVSSSTFVVHLSKVNDVWTPDCTYSQLYEAYQAGKEIAWELGEGNTNAVGEWGYVGEQNLFYYTVIEADLNYTTKFYSISANGVSSDGSEARYITTDATASPSDVTQGKTFYNANGKQTGTASSTINNQDKTVTPTTSQQSITADTGYTGLGTVTVEAMPIGSATGPTSLSASSATVTTGTNTLTLTKTGVSTTPTVSAGYISSATSSTATVALTASVTTKAAATITPTTTNQTIASGTYLTGTQTIAGDSNLVGSNILSGKSIFGVAGTVTFQTIHQGSSAPASSLGANGDVYIQV